MVQDDDQLVPWRTRVFAGVIVGLVFVLRRTWRVQFRDRELLRDAQSGGAVVLACWHGELATMVPLHEPEDVVGLTSLSADGGLAAAILNRLGYGVVRGSSSRGGDVAYRNLASGLRNGVSVAIAVDGPRGPNHFVHWGVARLSLETGRPIVFAVSRSKPAISLKSWDRFVIPMPFAKVELAYGRLEPCMATAPDVLAKQLQASMDALASNLRSFCGRSSDDSVWP